MVDEVKPLYKVGDKLRVLIDCPWAAPRVHIGDSIEILNVRYKQVDYYVYDFITKSGEIWGLNDTKHHSYVEFYEEPNDIEWWLEHRESSLPT